jgi:septal ring factor EnvC (AmiA/AmiB activator)
LRRDSGLIRKELVEIEMDMKNTEEMIKGSKAQLQMEDNQQLRDEIRSLEMNLIHLESQKRALEERLQELETTEES